MSKSHMILHTLWNQNRSGERSVELKPPAFLLDNSFQYLVGKSRQSLLSFLVNQTNSEIVTLNLSRLGENLSKDTSFKIKELVNNDVFYLASQLSLTKITLDLFNEVILLFNLLADECYKDMKLSQNLKSSTCLNFLLIAFTRYNNLAKLQVTSILELISKIGELFLIRPELINNWFLKCKEPDAMFYLHKLKLVSLDNCVFSNHFNYLPIFDLLRDFLFMEGPYHEIAKDGLLRLILLSNNSKVIHDWILGSEFPSIIITGLLSNFNEMCYNSTMIVNLKDNSLINKSAFISYQSYIEFLISLIENSSSEMIQVVFIDSFQKQFLYNAIECYYSYEVNHQINIIFLISFTIEKFLNYANIDDNLPVFNDLLLDCFKNEKFLQIFIISLLNDSNSQLNILSLKLVSKIIECRNYELIKELFCNNEKFTHEPNQGVNSGMFNELRIKTMNLITAYKSEDYLLIYLDKSVKRFEANQIQNQSSKSLTYLQYNPFKNLSLIIQIYLLKFFSNSREINTVLINLVLDLSTFHQGKVLDFLLNDETGLGKTHSTTIIFKIMSFLYDSMNCYQNELIEYPDIELFSELKPTNDLISKSVNFANNVDIFDAVSNWKSIPIEIQRESLVSNLNLFQKFYVEVYSCSKLREIISKNYNN